MLYKEEKNEDNKIADLQDRRMVCLERLVRILTHALTDSHKQSSQHNTHSHTDSHLNTHTHSHTDSHLNARHTLTHRQPSQNYTHTHTQTVISTQNKWVVVFSANIVITDQKNVFVRKKKESICWKKLLILNAQVFQLSRFFWDCDIPCSVRVFSPFCFVLVSVEGAFPSVSPISFYFRRC